MTGHDERRSGLINVFLKVSLFPSRVTLGVPGHGCCSASAAWMSIPTCPKLLWLPEIYLQCSMFTDQGRITETLLLFIMCTLLQNKQKVCSSWQHLVAVILHTVLSLSLIHVLSCTLRCGLQLMESPQYHPIQNKSYSRPVSRLLWIMGPYVQCSHLYENTCIDNNGRKPKVSFGFIVSATCL